MPSERKILAVLGSIQFTHILDFMIMMPLGPQFMRVFDIDARMFGVLVSAYTLSAAVSGFMGAPLMDRFDRKKTLVVLYLGFALGTFLCAIAPNYWMLLGARILAGAFGGILGGAVYSVIGDLIPVARRGAAMGTVMASFSVASVAGIPIGLWLANIGGWHMPFFALVALGLPVFYGIVKWLPPIRAHLDSGHPRHSFLGQVRAVFAEPNHIRAFSVMAAAMFGGFTVIPFVSAYLVSNTGFPESDLPYFYLVGGSLTFFTSRFIGRMSDRLGALRTFRRVGTASFIPILLITHLPPVPSWVVLLCGALFFVLVSGRFVPVMTLASSSTSPRLRGSFMTFQASIQSVANGIASLVAGWILTTQPDGKLLNYNWVGYLAVLSTCLAMFLAGRIQVRS